MDDKRMGVKELVVNAVLAHYQVTSVFTKSALALGEEDLLVYVDMPLGEVVTKVRKKAIEAWRPEVDDAVFQAMQQKVAVPASEVVSTGRGFWLMINPGEDHPFVFAAIGVPPAWQWGPCPRCQVPCNLQQWLCEHCGCSFEEF